MKPLYFICHDEQKDALPLIAVITAGKYVETVDIIETFTKALCNYVPGSEDCPPMRFAADKVCEEYGVTVEFVEAEQEFGIPEQKCTACSKCGTTLSEDHDSTAASPHNEGFSDETEVCWMCHIDMLERGELTQCGSCQECFTYNHLLPNKDGPDKTIEICPYCGEIWCE